MSEGDHVIPGDGLASWQVGIAAIRMEGVKSGRFLPHPESPAEIKASPIVDDVRRIGPCLLYNGDSTKITPLLEGMHACVTDPPYELGFMGKSWDSTGVAAAWETWGGVRIALRPGGHLVAFAGSRTYHRIAKAIDDAGFEVRDQVMWIYGSGFPKSLDVSKAIDKARREDADAIRAVCRFVRTAMDRKKFKSRHLVEHFDGCNPRLIDHWAARDTDSQPALPMWSQWLVLKTVLNLSDEMDGEVWRLNGRKGRPSDVWNSAKVVGEYEGQTGGFGAHRFATRDNLKRAASTVAQQWEGWGTALKPAHEPVCFARKPLSEKTVAENVLRWATGAINVDETRVGSDGGCAGAGAGGTCFGGGLNGTFAQPVDGLGRWPANVVTDGSLEVLEAFPPSARDAVRYFYAAKADKAEREFGMDGDAGVGALRDAGRGAARANFHPTVKPVDLMRWLCRLVTPPGGIVLDPFMGSGSTGIAAVRERFRFVGIEQSPEYFEIACKRVAAAVDFAAREPDLVREIGKALGKPVQGELL
jgi:DNA modification methylase